MDADLSVSRARSTAVDSSVPGPYIPGAIQKVASIGLSLDPTHRWSGGARLRYFGPRPLIEDNTIRSPGSTLLNLRAGYRIDARTRLSVDLLNALDRKVSDIDYAYASQLPGEAAPANDLHTHPAELRDELQGRLGTFPLFQFWGPGAGIASTQAATDRHGPSVPDSRRPA